MRQVLRCSLIYHKLDGAWTILHADPPSCNPNGSCNLLADPVVHVAMQRPQCQAQPAAVYNRREPPPRPAVCGVDDGGDGGLCPAAVSSPQDQPPQRMPAPASSPPRWQSAFGSIIQTGSDCLECADRQLVSDIQVCQVAAWISPPAARFETSLPCTLRIGMLWLVACPVVPQLCLPKSSSSTGPGSKCS